MHKNSTMIVDGTYYRDDGHGAPVVYKDDDGAGAADFLGGLAAVVIGGLLALKALSGLWAWFLGVFGA